MQGFTANGGEGRRHDTRYPADLPCRMLWDDGEEPGTICDISRFGMLIVSHYAPPIGTRITIIADWLEVIGTVTWQAPDKAGILLNHEIDPLRHLQHPTHERRDLIAWH